MESRKKRKGGQRRGKIRKQVIPLIMWGWEESPELPQRKKQSCIQRVVTVGGKELGVMRMVRLVLQDWQGVMR